MSSLVRPPGRRSRPASPRSPLPKLGSIGNAQAAQLLDHLDSLLPCCDDVLAGMITCSRQDGQDRRGRAIAFTCSGLATIPRATYRLSTRTTASRCWLPRFLAQAATKPLHSGRPRTRSAVGRWRQAEDHRQRQRHRTDHESNSGMGGRSLDRPVLHRTRPAGTERFRRVIHRTLAR